MLDKERACLFKGLSEVIAHGCRWEKASSSRPSDRNSHKFKQRNILLETTKKIMAS